MTGWKRLATRVLAPVGGLALAGLGGYFGVMHLDDADKWASVAGGVTALIGLPLAVYGAVHTQRTSEPAGCPTVAVGRDVNIAGRDQHFHRRSEG
jgi:hypothetical protein